MREYQLSGRLRNTVLKQTTKRGMAANVSKPSTQQAKAKESSPHLKASQSYTVRLHLKDKQTEERKNKRGKNETSITLNTNMKSW